eukprot:PhF_6_TR2239/c0_g2_i1/m.3795
MAKNFEDKFLSGFVTSAKPGGNTPNKVNTAPPLHHQHVVDNEEEDFGDFATAPSTTASKTMIQPTTIPIQSIHHQPLQPPRNQPPPPSSPSIPGGWPCSSCTFVNTPNNTSCAMCGTKQHPQQQHAARTQQQPPPPPSNGPPVKPCPACTYDNNISRTSCEICGTALPVVNNTGAQIPLARTSAVRPPVQPEDDDDFGDFATAGGNQAKHSVTNIKPTSIAPTVAPPPPVVPPVQQQVKAIPPITNPQKGTLGGTFGGTGGLISGVKFGAPSIPVVVPQQTTPAPTATAPPPPPSVPQDDDDDDFGEFTGGAGGGSNKSAANVVTQPAPAPVPAPRSLPIVFNLPSDITQPPPQPIVSQP